MTFIDTFLTTTGNAVASGIAALSFNTVDPKRWWLKDPLNASKNLALHLVPGTFVVNDNEVQNVVLLNGRPDPVVLSDTIKLPALTFGLIFLSDPEWIAFEQLRATQHTLLLQGPAPVGQWYVRLGAAIPVSTELATVRGWSATGQVIRNATQLTVQTVASP